MPKATKKTLKELAPAVASHQTKLVAEAKVILQNEVRDLFECFPHVEAIRWTQRRPLLNPDFAPVHKSDFVIDQVEYQASGRAGRRDIGMTDDGWVSPWNDSRVDSSDFLDTLAAFEEQLFEAEAALATALGDYDRVTITRQKVSFDQF